MKDDYQTAMTRSSKDSEQLTTAVDRRDVLRAGLIVGGGAPFVRAESENTDGTYSQVAKLDAGLDDISVSADGNIILAGSTVYEHRGGSWSQRDTLGLDDPPESYADSVSVSGDGTTAVIGAYEEDNMNGENAGAAYVFTQANNRWSRETRLLPTDGNDDDTFGYHVATSRNGTTIATIARFDDGVNGEKAGSLYVFERDDGTWLQQAKLGPEQRGPDNFGEALAVSDGGATIVVGAPNADGSRAGTARIYTRNGSSWRRQAALTPTDGDPGDKFGRGVGVSSDGMTIIVGAPNDADPNGTAGDSFGGSGAAYIFKRRNKSWSQQSKLAAEDGDPLDQFGYAVAISGDGTTAVIGAPGDEEPNGTAGDDSTALKDAAGSAYVYERKGDSWAEGTKLAAEKGAPRDLFGRPITVSTDGSTIATKATPKACVFKRAKDSRTLRQQFDDGDGQIQASEVLQMMKAYSNGNSTVSVMDIIMVIVEFNDSAKWGNVTRNIQ